MRLSTNRQKCWKGVVYRIAGYFSRVQIFTESPHRPSEENIIFAVLIFAPSINLSSSVRLTFMQLVTMPMVYIFAETNLSAKSTIICTL